MGLLYDRVKVNTSTVGVSTITLGSAIRSSTNGDFLTFAEIGVTDGTQVSYFIQDGPNWASGVGTYNVAGSSLSRDANEKRWNGTTYSTAALSLSGSAVVYISARAADIIQISTSVTDNAVPRFDGATGTLMQTSALSVADDGSISSATNSGANAVAVPLTNWVMLTADYTLSSSVSEQKAFNTTTNGTLTLPTGVYRFGVFLYLTTMNATSGNLAFDPVGAGTAVTDRWGQHVIGIDNNTPLNAGTQTGSAAVTQQTVASAVTAGTGTGMIMSDRGMFRISTGGTIIPSVTLVTANAAVVKAGSYFWVERVGDSGVTSVGAWT